MIAVDRAKRREVICLLGGAILLVPLRARAQEPGRLYRIGAVHSAPRDAPHHIAFFQELRKYGYVEGRNLEVDRRGYGLRVEQFAEHAAELVAAGVDIILAGGDAAVRAAQQATTSIPILALTDDMVGQGFVRALAVPGGNTTGVSILASELDGKRQEILLLALPGVRRIAALVDIHTTQAWRLESLVADAHARAVALSIHRVAAAEEIGPAIDSAKSSNAEALNVLASSLLFNNRHVIFERVSRYRLPAIYQWPEMAAEGGLLGYGPSIVQLYRDIMARQLVRLLRGAKPREVPVEQPTKFELVINLKTARALGIAIPSTALDVADRVIE